jgi:hypothetical protein
MENLRATKRKRCSNEAPMKIKIAEYAIQSNNSVAARHYGIRRKALKI